MELCPIYYQKSAAVLCHRKMISDVGDHFIEGPQAAHAHIDDLRFSIE